VLAVLRLHVHRSAVFDLALPAFGWRGIALVRARRRRPSAAGRPAAIGRALVSGLQRGARGRTALAAAAARPRAPYTAQSVATRHLRQVETHTTLPYHTTALSNTLNME
jgi:hypothetical protein